jgi:ABC-2 type transport system permease protein
MSTRRLLRAQLRTSLALAMQYRADFLIDGVIEAFWTATALVPLFVVYGNRASIAGWAFGEALLVTAFFTMLQGILEGVVNPCVAQAVEQIRKGTFDFVLLKPHDAQLLVSTARVMPWRSINVVTAIVLVAWGFTLLGRVPSASNLALAALSLAASLTILYSLWMVSVTLAFWVIKVDNLTFLFGSIFDAARWPISVFKGVLRFVFTFLVPLAMMTTFPAEALLGRAGWSKAGLACATAVIAFSLSRTVWKRALSRYTSASS